MPSELTKGLVTACIASLIRQGESETFSSDDAEARPDPESLWMLANVLHIEDEVSEQLGKLNPGPERVYIAMIGNLSTGYEPVGPFPTFDDAAAFREEETSWIMEVTSPEEYAEQDD